MRRRPAQTTMYAALLAILTGVLSVAPAAADDKWRSAYAETTETLRVVGLALLTWRFEMLPEPIAIEGRNRHFVEDLPVISADELERHLVPDRLESLPRADAWGRALEFRVDREAEGEPIVLIRSRGADGRWDGRVYTAGAVAPGGSADDLVWADGYFVRWPDAADD